MLNCGKSITRSRKDCYWRKIRLAITRTFSKMSLLTFSHFQIEHATSGTVRVTSTSLSPSHAAAPVDKDMRKLQVIVNRVAGDQRTALVSFSAS